MQNGWHLTSVDTITSTMDWAHAQVQAKAPDFSAIVAATQSGGRGRRGRVWQSPRGNLYFSFIVRPRTDIAGLFPLAIALALHRALTRFLPSDAGITVKWPNDVLVDGRKIAGILIERNDEALIVGIGVNIATAPEGAAKIGDWRGEIAIDAFLSALMSEIREIYRHADPEELVAAWNAHAAYLGQDITFMQGAHRVTGIFEGVDGQGHALLRCEGEQKAFASGEVMEVRPCS